MIRVLAIGDVVSEFGCNIVRKNLPKIKREYDIDLVICNGENSAKGNGITPKSADMLFSYGVDIITGGNHCFRRREIYDYLDDNAYIIRPANYLDSAPGKGYITVSTNKGKVTVINLLGIMDLESLDNPFRKIDSILENTDKSSIIIVDFHAEATAEKQALGYFLDARVSAVFGTHTHVQTADARVLQGGTGYISDLGMCGAKNSVLGVKKEIIIQKFIDNMPAKFESCESGEELFNACLFEIDEKTGKTISITPINR